MVSPLAANPRGARGDQSNARDATDFACTDLNRVRYAKNQEFRYGRHVRF